MAATSPTPRRVAKPSWLDARLVLGVLLVLGSVLVGAVVVARASDTHPVVAAARSLAAGTTLRAGDLTVVQVQLPDDGSGLYVVATKDAVGKTLVRPVSRGEILPLAAVATSRPTETVTIPLGSGAAPSLRKGQRVEVWVSTKSCSSVVILADVVVQDVRTDTGTFTGTGGQDVVVSVDPAVADRVAAALGIDGAVFRAGVLSGGTPTATPTADPTPAPAGQLPSDLAGCVSPSPSR